MHQHIDIDHIIGLCRVYAHDLDRVREKQRKLLAPPISLNAQLDVGVLVDTGPSALTRRSWCPEAQSGQMPRLQERQRWKEGQGRLGGADVSLLGMALRVAESYGTIMGRKQTVGIGQMRPDVAAALSKKYFNVKMSEPEARAKRAVSDCTGIQLAAANLRDLKDRHSLSDAQACVAYAGSDDLIVAWQSGSRERAPLLFDRETGCKKRYEVALRFWEMADQR
ncbi:hypothetical protein [Streptomyces sp. NPDC054837]